MFKPQSALVAIWPPQARTGFATDAVNVIVILRELSPVGKPAPCEYKLTAVIVPPYIVKSPAAGVTPAPVTCGSAGIGDVVEELHPLTPRHGSAVATVRLNVVR